MDTEAGVKSLGARIIFREMSILQNERPYDYPACRRPITNQPLSPLGQTVCTATALLGNTYDRGLHNISPVNEAHQEMKPKA